MMNGLYDYQIKFLIQIFESDKPLRFKIQRWSGKHEVNRLQDEIRQLQKTRPITVYPKRS